MRILRADNSLLLVIDFQERLMPAIHGGEAAMVEARRLIDIAGILGVPVRFTEQRPEKLGTVVPALHPDDRSHVAAKVTFDSCRKPGFVDWLPQGDVVAVGSETHVCVLQTVLGLLDAGRKVFVVEDAVGSRTPANKAAGLRRMSAHGADIVTAEMVAFEWLGTAEHPRFREVIARIK